jgi:hypothetical protein
MAEISKLSVGQALDKLRGTDAPSSKMTQLDSKSTRSMTKCDA